MLARSILGVALSTPVLAAQGVHLMAHVGTAGGSGFGGSAFAIGDVAGPGGSAPDGIIDFAVASTATAPGAAAFGSVSVYDGATGSSIMVVSGTITAPGFGSAVIGAEIFPAFAGDELLVGDTATDTVTVYDVPSGAVLGTITPLAVAGTVPVGGLFGSTMVNLGDLTGDGLDEVAIGLPGAAAAPYPAGGTVDIVDGASVLGLGPGVSTTLVSPGGAFSVPTAGDLFGFTLAASDLTGDGLLDLAVGAPGTTATPAIGGVGTVSLYVSTAAGVPALPTAAFDGPDVLAGAAVPGQSFGSALDGAGDLGGAAFGDLVVSGFTGLVYVLELDATLTPGLVTTIADPVLALGSAVAGVGDMDGDGVADILSASGASDTVVVYSGADYSELARFTEEPLPAGADAFGAALADLGDTDGDGRAECLVGNPAYAQFDPASAGVVDLGRGRTHVIGLAANYPPLAMTGASPLGNSDLTFGSYTPGALTVDGSTGGAARNVAVAASPFTVAVASPLYSGASGSVGWLLYAELGVPAPVVPFSSPALSGSMVVSPLTTATLLAASGPGGLVTSSPTPASFPLLVGFPLTYTMQGIVFGVEPTGGLATFQTTNAVSVTTP